MRRDNFFFSPPPTRACDSDYNIRSSAMAGCGTTSRMLLDPWNLLAALVLLATGREIALCCAALVFTIGFPHLGRLLALRSTTPF